MAINNNFWQQTVTFGNKWQTLATFQFLHLLERLGKLWQILAIISVDSHAVSDSQWECAAVCNSPWQFSGSQGSLC